MHSTFSGLKETFQKCEVPLERVAKVHVFLKNIKDLPEMEKVFSDYFAADSFPARMTTTTEFIDSDCLMMIDGVAYTGV
ncbi:RidA family protein [Paenibacillus sp. FJAT-26967]|uniref:RidA family protein n=1 Tax=Paenibacillus sp. FJAT-26967 TaxID=1729690 RepID=UPI0009FD301D|nr:RidA family protein [Paenibacillus sp. FJAT-26967]